MKNIILGLVSVSVFVVGAFGFVPSVLAKAGDPIASVPIGLDGDPGSIKVSATTDENGAYTFTNLPPGKYKLSIPGQPTKSVTVGTDGKLGGVALEGEPIRGVDENLGKGGANISITSSDLGITNVGTLPTSRFYFLKNWGRGIDRLFTWRALSKVKLEFEITNQIAAELLEVDKNSTNDAKMLEKALKNYTKAQEKLNARITSISVDPSDVNLVKLLKNVDDTNVKHAELLEQLAQGSKRFEDLAQSHEVRGVIKDAQNNLLKTFTITVTATNDAPALKQKAEQQIASAEEAIKKAEIVFGQPVTFTANIIKTSDNGTKLYIDGNGKAYALTDGLLILRYLFGLTGSSLAVSPTGVNNDTALDIDGNSKYDALTDGLLMIRAILDIDGNGQADALTDGLLIIRYMSGLRGTALVSAPTGDKVHQSPNLLVPIVGVNIIAKDNSGGVAVTTSTDSNGSFELTGLDSGEYDIFIAGELVKRLIVGTAGGIWRGRVITLVTDPSDISGNNVWTGNLIIIANAKGHLASAKEAFAAGKYGEAYGLTRSAEAMISGNFTTGGATQAPQSIKQKPAEINKESGKILENDSPRPTEQKEEPKPGTSGSGATGTGTITNDDTSVSSPISRPGAIETGTGTTPSAGETIPANLGSSGGARQASEIKVFTVRANDSKADLTAITVSKGNQVQINFNVDAEGTYRGGLDFRSSVADTGPISPGGVGVVVFTADKSFGFTPYWPSSSVAKPYTIQVIVE